MNSVLKVIIIAALLLILGAMPVQTYAQRCAGSFVYFVRNQKGDLIDDKEKLEMKYQRYNSSPEGMVAKVGDQMFGLVHLVKHPIDENKITPDERTEWVKVLRIQTGCGQPFGEVELEYENQKMVLRFLNMPPETNFLLDSLPFQEGTLVIDFKGDSSLKNQKLNRDGLRHKEGKYYQRGTARIGLLVSAENWIRVESR